MTRGLGTAFALSLLAHGGAVAAVGVLGVAWLGGSPPAPARAPLFVDLVQPLVATNDRLAPGDAPPSRWPPGASPAASPGPAVAKPRADSGVPAAVAAAGSSASEPAPRPSAGPPPTLPEIAPPPAPPLPAAAVAPEPRRAPAEPAPPVAGTPTGSAPAPSSATSASGPVPAIAEPPREDPAAGIAVRALPPSPVRLAVPGEGAPALPSSAPPLAPPGAYQGAPVAAHATRAADRASPIPSSASPADAGAATGAHAADPGSVARVQPGDAESSGHDANRPATGPASAPAGGAARGPDGRIGDGAVPPEYEPYLRALRQRVQDRLVYPWMAVRRGQQGVVELEVHLGPEGRLVGVEILAGPTTESLRVAAVTAVRGAAPFPFPPGLQGRALIIRLPVEFRLR